MSSSNMGMIWLFRHLQTSKFTIFGPNFDKNNSLEGFPDRANLNDFHFSNSYTAVNIEVKLNMSDNWVKDKLKIS